MQKPASELLQGLGMTRRVVMRMELKCVERGEASAELKSDKCQVACLQKPIISIEELKGQRLLARATP